MAFIEASKLADEAGEERRAMKEDRRKKVDGRRVTSIKSHNVRVLYAQLLKQSDALGGGSLALAAIALAPFGLQRPGMTSRRRRHSPLIAGKDRQQREGMLENRITNNQFNN